MNISYDKNEELSYVSDLFPFSGVDNLTNLMYLLVPGYSRPEGIIIFHIAGNVGFKKTLEKDG